MKEKLKPCPFCRKKAIVCEPLEEITGWVIRCKEWGCCEKGLHPFYNKKADLDRLVEAWNRRKDE